MKEKRYAAYQSLLKALAQAVIAHRPAGWTEGTLLLERQGTSVVCRLLREGEGEGAGRPVEPVVEAHAVRLAQAFAEHGTPWVRCRVGFFRKAVGWGVSVRITPTAGGPEVDLSAPPREPAEGEAVEAAEVVVEAQDTQPTTGDEAQDTRPLSDEELLLIAPAPAAAPVPPVAVIDEPWRLCPHCKAQALRLVLREGGIDTFRCQACGTTLSMHGSEALFEPAVSRVGTAGAWVAPVAPPAPEGLRRESDQCVVGPDFSIRLSGAETLLYKAGSGTVPLHLRREPGNPVQVVEAARVTTMDTAFGSRMLTPREHAVIVQNLKAAVPLLAGHFEID